MGLLRADDAADPAHAVAFWTRFWDDRGIEFRSASVRSAVRRLVRYGSTSRAAELLELDTFALQTVIAALQPPRDTETLEQARALVDVAAHIAEIDDLDRPGRRPRGGPRVRHAVEVVLERVPQRLRGVHRPGAARGDRARDPLRQVGARRGHPPARRRGDRRAGAR